MDMQCISMCPPNDTLISTSRGPSQTPLTFLEVEAGRHAERGAALRHEGLHALQQGALVPAGRAQLVERAAGGGRPQPRHRRLPEQGSGAATGLTGRPHTQGGQQRGNSSSKPLAPDRHHPVQTNNGNYQHTAKRGQRIRALI